MEENKDFPFKVGDRVTKLWGNKAHLKLRIR